MKFSRYDVFLFRNNLTILDLVVVQGQGAYTNFNINNNPPGGKKSILLFEIKPIHLKDCNSKQILIEVYCFQYAFYLFA